MIRRTFCISLVFVCLALTASAEQFTDDFNDGDLSNWTVCNGPENAWWPCSGHVCNISEGLPEDGRDLCVGEASWSVNYVEATVYIPAADVFVGLGTDGAPDFKYFFVDQEPGGTRIQVIKGPGQQNNCTGDAWSFPTTVTLRLEKIGNVLRATAGGQTCDVTLDPGDDLAGRAKLRRGSSSTAIVWFDDIVVDGALGLSDPDADGVYDWFDNCPANYNPDQSDADSDGTGDVCDSSHLIAHWPLDGNPLDASGNGHDGTLNGSPVPITGKVGDAYEFDGSDDFIRVLNHPQLNFGSGDFSVSLWVRPDYPGVANRVAISKYTPSGAGAGWLVASYQDDHTAEFWGRVYETSSQPWFSGRSATPIEGWHHLAGRRKGQTAELWVDGVLESSGPIGPGSVSISRDLYIGWEDGLTKFDGAIDEVRLYDLALTPAQISCLAYLDDDPDGDGWCGNVDNCPSDSNPTQADTNGDGTGDACDTEICDGLDNDGDGSVDEGFADTDGDTVADCIDNCPVTGNLDQADSDTDGTGDVCDDCTDTDADGYGNPGFPANICVEDNCPADPNPGQLDADTDATGDACDPCTDTDGDGLGDPGYPVNTCSTDNCPDDPNPGQEDADLDGTGDACDVEECDGLDNDGDGSVDEGFAEADGDGVADCIDNCSGTPNPGQEDADLDGTGDVCDLCTDTDNDGFGNPGFPGNTCADDNCPTITNSGQEDNEADGLGDVCDSDDDNDGCGDTLDAEPWVWGPDPDSDDVAEGCDNCPLDLNRGQEDGDGDGTGDACDDCIDTDQDGVGDPGQDGTGCASGTDDNCPLSANTGQEDADGDGHGDACDNCDLIPNGDCSCPGGDCDADGTLDCDADGDGTVTADERSAGDQRDSDGDGTGDVCEAYDLTVDARDIRPDPAGPAVNETVRLHGKVRNVGQTEVTGVTVAWYSQICDQPASLLDTVTYPDTIPAGGFLDVVLDWQFDPAGVRQIIIEADWDDTYDEATETNNQGAIILEVGSPDTQNLSIVLSDNARSSYPQGGTVSVSGAGTYDILEDGQPCSTYPVKGGLVHLKVVTPSGCVDTGCTTVRDEDVGFTDDSGRYSYSFPTPGAARETYDQIVTVTDGTLASSKSTGFTVAAPSPPPSGSGSGGSGGGYTPPPSPGPGGCPAPNLDIDGDGVLNVDDLAPFDTFSGSTAGDFDNDGEPDGSDDDADNDGVLNVDDPAQLDADRDDDGIPDGRDSDPDDSANATASPPLVDLDAYLRSMDITFSNDNPSLDETIAIRAKIHASGDGAFECLPIRFFATYPTVGEKIPIGPGQEDGLLVGGGSSEFSTSWTNFAEGFYIIEASVERADPPPYSDANNGNNAATRSILVGGANNVLNVVIESPPDLDPDRACIEPSCVTNVVVRVADGSGAILPPVALDSVYLDIIAANASESHDLRLWYDSDQERYIYPWTPGPEYRDDVTLKASAQRVGPVDVVENGFDETPVHVDPVACLDADSDTHPNCSDNCPFVWNMDQANCDTDALGDVCDNCDCVDNQNQSDLDADGSGDLCDNCPLEFNPAQTDADGDSCGDPCDPIPATIRVVPRTLNKKSQGNDIKIKVDLRPYYTVDDVDPAEAIVLYVDSGGPVLDLVRQPDAGDSQVLIVSFDRQEVQNLAPLGQNVEFIVTGLMTYGCDFSGVDHIRVIDEGRPHNNVHSEEDPSSIEDAAEKGNVSELGTLGDGDLGNTSCEDPFQSNYAFTLNLDLQDPLPGEAFFYLYKFCNGTAQCDLGQTSSGNPRTPSNGACP